jgi:hypothetical protein
VPDEPGQPEPPPAGPIEAKVWPTTTKAERISAVRDLLDQGYSLQQVRAWAVARTPDKGWQVSKHTAGIYINSALELIDAEVVAPKARKQARTRGMLTLFARRAYELATAGDLKHKAAGLITAGVAALDKIARIDGAYAYDSSSLLPPSTSATTPEEAVRIVAHATALMELALRRGALVSADVSPPVIDATSAEVDDEDGGDIDETSIESDDAN